MFFKVTSFYTLLQYLVELLLNFMTCVKLSLLEFCPISPVRHYLILKTLLFLHLTETVVQNPIEVGAAAVEKTFQRHLEVLLQEQHELQTLHKILVITEIFIFQENINRLFLLLVKRKC